VFVKVNTYWPEDLKEKGNPALIFAHGGWCIFNDAVGSSHTNMQEWCYDYKCVGFNVDFRNAPEVKAPGGCMDIVETI